MEIFMNFVWMFFCEFLGLGFWAKRDPRIPP
jgi:hypothetical protein